MEELNNNFLSPNLDQMVDRYMALRIHSGNRQANNDKVVGTALVYERFRVALEYQEEHLVFKNAISRILRRKYAFTANPTADKLSADLLSELAWANYINTESIKPDEHTKIKSTIERYLMLLKSARSGQIKKGTLQKMIINWLACEIDEILKPSNEKDPFLSFAFEIMNENLSLEHTKVGGEENEIQLKLAIYSLVFKPDYWLLQYWVLKSIYPNWQNFTADEMQKVGLSFDPYFNKVERAFNHPLRRSYILFAKRNIAPLILLHRVLISDKVDLSRVREKPAILQNMMMDQYNQMVREARNKVWRGTFRALIFIFLTKISLAFLLEIPFDRMISGGIDYLSLIINVSLPPLLMLISGTFVKSPPATNYKTVSDATSNLITKGVIVDRQFSLAKSGNSPLNMIFNITYSLVSLGILCGVIWGLIALDFNVISIILFFVFVSAVSFFSFRIRNIALELAMKRNRDDALTSAFEFIFLPFIRIGRYLSDQIAAFNPFIIALDFVIEAPLKTIIKFMNSWLRFVNSKKEDLEF